VEEEVVGQQVLEVDNKDWVVVHHTLILVAANNYNQVQRLVQYKDNRMLMVQDQVQDQLLICTQALFSFCEFFAVVDNEP